MSELLFNPDTHEYTRDGIRIPSVTQVLASVGIIDRTWFDDESAWRGSVIHKVCELDDLGDLDEGSVAPELMLRLGAWRKFKLDAGISKFDFIEKPEYSALGYAGTPDRVLFASRLLVDLKSGEPTKAAAIQTAAYVGFFMYPQAWRRLIVRLSDDGSYSCRVHMGSQHQWHMGIFRAALAVYQYKEQK